MRATRSPIAAPSAFMTGAYDEPIPVKPTTAKGKGKGKANGNPWIAHVKAYQAAHPGMSWKDAMKEAKHTYKKNQVGGLVTSSARKARALRGDKAAQKRKAAEKKKKAMKAYYY